MDSKKARKQIEQAGRNFERATKTIDTVQRATSRYRNPNLSHQYQVTNDQLKSLTSKTPKDQAVKQNLQHNGLKNTQENHRANVNESIVATSEKYGKQDTQQPLTNQALKATVSLQNNKSIDGGAILLKNDERKLETAIPKQSREKNFVHQNQNVAGVGVLSKGSTIDSYVQGADPFITSEESVAYLYRILDNPKYKDIVSPQIKEEIVQLVKNGTVQTEEVVQLLKTTKMAARYGVSVRGSDGILRSESQIRFVGQLQKIIGGRKSGYTNFSKGSTLGLKTVGKSAKVIGYTGGALSKLSTIGEDSYDSDTNQAMTTLNEIVTGKAKRVGMKASRKLTQSVAKNTYRGAKTVLKSEKYIRKAATKGTMRFTQILMNVFHSTKAFIIKLMTIVAPYAGAVLIPTALITLCFSIFLTLFFGTDSSKRSYEHLFQSVQSEYFEEADSIYSSLLKRVKPQPSKEEFEHISDKDYKELIKTQYKPDQVNRIGTSQIDFKAQMSLMQSVGGPGEMQNETVASDMIALEKYWMDQGIVEKHIQGEQTNPYTVTWMATKEEVITAEVTHKNKKTAISQCVSKVLADRVDGYKIKNPNKIEDDVVVKKNYERVEQKDENGNVIGSKIQVKDYTASFEKKMKLEKKCTKNLEQKIYTLTYKNGTLDDYINITNDAFRLNSTITINNISIGSSGGGIIDNGPMISGDTIHVPNMEQHYTCTGYDKWLDTGRTMNWAINTGQGVVNNQWKQQGSLFKNGIAVLNDRYLVATTTTFGVVGDSIDVTLENGTVLKCIIADTKSANDPNCTKWGHTSGNSTSVLEFEVEYQTFNSLKTNPGTSKWLPEWDSNVVKVKNNGGRTQAVQNTSLSTPSSSKHLNKTFTYEEILRQKLFTRKTNDEGNSVIANSKEDLNEIPNSVMENIRFLYEYGDPLDGFNLSSGSVSFGSFGFDGSVKDPIKKDELLVSKDDMVKNFGNPLNPFGGNLVGQCTWFAWSRFYQIYGYSPGTHGNGKTNAQELVSTHPDKFQLSDTPAPGSMFSIYDGPGIMPEYGHVGIVEAVDGDTMWVSEGNYNNQGIGYFHKVSISSWRSQFTITYAVPIKK